MQFTNEQINKAKQAKSVEELMKIAKENGFEMTEEQAKTYFAELHKKGELTDEELDAVAGGKGEPESLYHKDDKVVCGGMPDGDWTWYIVDMSYNWDENIWYYKLTMNGFTQFVKESDIKRKL